MQQNIRIYVDLMISSGVSNVNDVRTIVSDNYEENVAFVMQRENIFSWKLSQEETVNARKGFLRFLILFSLKASFLVCFFWLFLNSGQFWSSLKATIF